jgi:hypothetical protein
MACPPASPNNVVGKLVGTVPPSGPFAGFCYIGCLYGGLTAVGVFDTATPAVSLGYLGNRGMATGGGILDLLIDPTTNELMVAEVDGVGGPANSLIVWKATLPLLAFWSPAVVIDGPVANGWNYIDAVLMVADSHVGIGNRAMACVFMYSDMSTSAYYNELYHVWIDVTDPPWIPPPPLPTPKTLIRRTESCNRFSYAFLKQFTGGSASQAVYVESTADPLEGDIYRTVFSVETPVLEAKTMAFDLKGASWVSGAFTSWNIAGAQALRIYTSADVFGSVDPGLASDNIHIKYEMATKRLYAINDSPFTWMLKLVALEETGYSEPPSLLIPCWQLAQALQNYWNDNGYYPSPSTLGVSGVSWTENELATTPTPNPGGPEFDDYYTVPPGQWDLEMGALAQALYHAREAAGLASHHAMAFRYNSYPSEIAVAEAIINAAIIAALPLPVGTGANPDFYTLAELDVILGTAFAATYAGLPYAYYQYFCTTDSTGNLFLQGWYSKNYIINSQAYGPAPSGVSSIPVVEHFMKVGDAVPGVPTDFTLAQTVLAAQVFVNGVEYYQGIHWVFSGMGVISYLNDPSDFVLTDGSRISVWKYLPS